MVWLETGDSQDTTRPGDLLKILVTDLGCRFLISELAGISRTEYSSEEPSELVEKIDIFCVAAEREENIA